MKKWVGAMCRAFDCDNEASWDIDIMPICPEHAWQIAQHYEQALAERAAQLAAQKVQHAHEVGETKRGNREDPVVYYARIGDYIKIGYTTRLRNRLRTLRVDELLAVEPGHADLERTRHRQFDDDRIDLRRENFRPSPALTQHIAALRELHTLPHWATRPRTATITRRTQENA